MARDYPRFLFSNPTNTKSKGPFIVHTLPPRMIMKVEPHKTFGFYCINLDQDTRSADEDVVIRDAESWLKKQIESGEIKL